MKLHILPADGVITSESHKSCINISSMAHGTQASRVYGSLALKPYQEFMGRTSLTTVKGMVLLLGLKDIILYYANTQHFVSYFELHMQY